MKLLVLLNPQAHGGRAGEQQEELQRLLDHHALDAQIELTTRAGAAQERVAGLQAGQFDAVVAAGGDGTLFEIVNGLMSRASGQRESLGVIPMGTGNAFARELDLVPGAVEKAVELISKGLSSPVDVAEVTTSTEHFHFINILGLGLVTEAARSAVGFKSLGRGAYTLGALAALIRLPVSRPIIELDGKTLPVQDMAFLQVANSRFTGTHFVMAPGARINDGLLDVVLVKALSRRRALRLFPMIYDGRHVDADEVTVRRASSIVVSEPAGLRCAVDGEFRGATPLNIRAIPAAINLLGVPLPGQCS